MDTLPPHIDAATLLQAYEHWNSGQYHRMTSVAVQAPDNQFLVSPGKAPFMQWVQALRFSPQQIQQLGAQGMFEESFLNYLQRFSFTCTVEAAPEGAEVLPGHNFIWISGPLIQITLARAALLAMSGGEIHTTYTYDYPRPALTVDCVIFGYQSGRPLQALLIERARPPFEEFWALPGGFVEMKEDLREAALRELKEEAGVGDIFIEQLQTFGRPGRDPRGRVVSVAYYALVNLSEHPVKADSDARNAAWFAVEELPPLAFDHAEIVEVAVRRLRAKLRYKAVGFELLPERFTLTQLQELYETVLGVTLNKRNFRTRILKTGVLKEAGIQERVSHRPARLFRFDKEKYEQFVSENYPNLLRRGVDFEM